MTSIYLHEESTSATSSEQNIKWGNNIYLSSWTGNWLAPSCIRSKALWRMSCRLFWPETNIGTSSNSQFYYNHNITGVDGWYIFQTYFYLFLYMSMVNDGHKTTKLGRGQHLIPSSCCTARGRRWSSLGMSAKIEPLFIPIFTSGLMAMIMIDNILNYSIT